ncbi:hypothetical protein ACFW04_013579 [Cataglyphis niger]
MQYVHKRKQFWSIISEELNSQNIEVSELACKKKWQNLMSTGKNTKDVKFRTRRGPIKFTFYDRLDIGNFLKKKFLKEKEISRKFYVEENFKYKKEKLELYKEKLEIEKKKIKAFEDLQNILKEKNTND